MTHDDEAARWMTAPDSLKAAAEAATARLRNVIDHVLIEFEKVGVQAHGYLRRALDEQKTYGDWNDRVGTAFDTAARAMAKSGGYTMDRSSPYWKCDRIALVANNVGVILGWLDTKDHMFPSFAWDKIETDLARYMSNLDLMREE